MGEIEDIETAIDTLVAYNFDDLDQLGAKYAALVALSALLTALTDNDINAYDVATARAALINAVDCIEKLITKMTTDYTARYRS